MKLSKLVFLLIALLAFSVTLFSCTTERWCYRYAVTKEDDKAIDECTKAIELNPKNGVSYHNRGVAYYRKGQYDKAIEDFGNVIELHPSYALAYYSRGVVYVRKRQFGQAIVDFTKSIELNPTEPDAYVNRGLSYKNTGDNERAMDDYNKALELESKVAATYKDHEIIMPVIYNNRGVLYRDMGDYDKAVDDLKKAIEIEPTFVAAYYSLACTASVRNNSAEACNWLKKAVDMGYNDWDYMKRDDKLENIRDTSCYKEIMAGK